MKELCISEGPSVTLCPVIHNLNCCCSPKTVLCPANPDNYGMKRGIMDGFSIIAEVSPERLIQVLIVFWKCCKCCYLNNFGNHN